MRAPLISSLHPNAPILRKPAKREPGALKIALNTRSHIDTEVHPECIQAAREAALLLESLGHAVGSQRPDMDGQPLAKSYLTMYFGESHARGHGHEISGPEGHPA